MRNSWDVRSDLQSETMDEDADASMQRLLTEAWAEFGLEEPAEIPGSVYVERCPKEETSSPPPCDTCTCLMNYLVRVNPCA